MKAFLFFLLIPFVCYATTDFIDIDAHFSATKSNQLQHVYKDTNATLHASDIMAATFEAFHGTISSVTKDVFWIKFNVRNSSSEPQKVILEHSRAGLDFIDLYLYKEGVLFQKSELGDMRSKENRSINHFNSAEILTLEPNTTYTVISRLQSYGSYELRWNIKSLHSFTFSASIKTIVWGFLGGVLMALALYSVVLYGLTRGTFYLVYSGYALSLFTFRFIYEGFAYQYFHIENLSLLTISAWIWLRMTLLFLFLIPYYLFQLQKNLLGTLLLTCAFYELCWVVFYSTAIVNMDILYLSIYSAPIDFIMLLFLIFISVLVLIQKRPGSFYFTIAIGVFALYSFYNGLIIVGYIQEEEYSWLVLPFGVVTYLLFLALAHGEKIKLLHKQQRKSENLLIAQSRFIAIGQTVGNITHQWKTPISQLASQFMFLHATLIHKKEVLLQEFEKKIPQIIHSIAYMQESIDLFSNFFKYSNEKTEFSPIQEMKAIEKMLEVKLMLNTIQMRISSEIDTLYTHKSALMNCLMILCENAIDVLIEKKTEERIIDIFFQKENDTSINVVVQDNAGELDQQTFNKLFVESFSTKIDNFGLGLSMVKTLVENRLEGMITPINLPTGLCFKITIPLEK